MIGYDDKQCRISGGVICIRSFFKRLCLMIVESGVQELLVSLGIKLGKVSQSHTWLHWDLNWVIKSHLKCANEGEAFFVAVLALDISGVIDRRNYFEYIMYTCIQKTAMSAWKYDLIEGHRVLNPIILDLIFGPKL